MILVRKMSRFAILASLLAFSATGAWAATPAPGQDEDPAIVQHMKQVNRGLRRLRRQVADPAQKDSSLQLVRRMKTGVQAAQKEEPLKTPDLPEAERGPFLKAFGEKMDAVIETLTQLESALEHEKFDQAEELVKKLFALKKEGHDKFQKEIEIG